MEFVQSSDQVAASDLEYTAYYSGSIRSCDRLDETGQRGTHGGVHQRHIEIIRENQRENFPQKSQKNPGIIAIPGFFMARKEGFEPSRVV